jgi:hypothetical protein
MKKSLLIVVLSILIWQPSFAKMECDNKNYSKRGESGVIYECIDLDKNNICYFTYYNGRLSISCVKLD